MALDPRLPVIVGVGEITHRDGDAVDTEPCRMMADAVRAAAQDAGAPGLLERVGAIAAVPTISWLDGDPAARAAELLGLEGVATMRSSKAGGNGPGLLLATLAERIQDGQLDGAILCGAEAVHTLGAILKRGEQLPWPPFDPDRRTAEVLEPEAPPSTEAELAVGITLPLVAYPLLENALRHAAGRSPAEQLELISRVWARFSEVAAEQPAAWSPQAYTAQELATPSKANRLVTLPYTKLLNANLQVDQGGALLLCSVGTAQGLGIASDRWVFLNACANAIDEWFMSERRVLDRSPAIRACGEAVLGHAGVSAEEIGPIDLYSCFPAAVQLAARELGLPFDDHDRPLTCTGGLTFFGGPGNNYFTHGVAAVVRRLREAPPGTLGLSTGLGWYATKHALGLYGNSPPARPYAALTPEPETPSARTVADADGEATVETATVVYDREGAPTYGVVFALRDDGRRALGRTEAAEVMAAIERDDFLGSRVRVAADRSFSA
ncbi:MAG TPA: acetyl-CoA acetyltransferase [Solirubrobacteraceae bacterium]|jgi:acetyl-CoA C-acetyltransferase|nr:acetyl-CoA acetyltransferase [Solirubrobacteraceae bacterium]